MLAPPYHLNYILYYCDYFYQSSGTRYILRGGHCAIGYQCGFLYANINSAYTWGAWYLGATLSFKHYASIIVIILFKILLLIVILFMAVIYHIIRVVVLSALLLMLLVPGLVIILVPVYHLKHTYYCDYFVQTSSRNYSARGGRSGQGRYCGTFDVSIRNPFGGSEWSIGACLSFKLILFIVIILFKVMEVEDIQFVVLVQTMVIIVELFQLL